MIKWAGVKKHLTFNKNYVIIYISNEKEVIIIARGSLAKTNIGNAILQVFPGAFIDADKKTIRIPTTCEGDVIEIKITMTAAKDLVGGNTVSVATSEQVQPQNRAMTDEEVNEIRELIKRLNL